MWFWCSPIPLLLLYAISSKSTKPIRSAFKILAEDDHLYSPEWPLEKATIIFVLLQKPLSWFPCLTILKPDSGRYKSKSHLCTQNPTMSSQVTQSNSQSPYHDLEDCTVWPPSTALTSPSSTFPRFLFVLASLTFFEVPQICQVSFMLLQGPCNCSFLSWDVFLPKNLCVLFLNLLQAFLYSNTTSLEAFPGH